jgi:tellurite resistance protein TerC
MNESWATVAFVGFILVMLAIDLGVFNRKSHEISPKQAAIFVSIWMAIAAIFNVGVYYTLGSEKGLQFTTAYLIEQILSVDNMFVFVLVMHSFQVPKEHQHRLLFFGVLGALVMRAVMIFAGVALIHRFHWLLYVFGAFLLYTGIRVIYDATQQHEEPDPAQNPIVRFARRTFPTLEHNPMLLALVCIEVTDVIFALDSIPAIFAITDDTFILFSSNVLAILGLRSLYFLLAHALDKFHMLKYGVGIILGFVGLKMITGDVVQIPMTWSLAIILAIVAGFVVLSFVVPSRPGPSESKTR